MPKKTKKRKSLKSMPNQNRFIATPSPKFWNQYVITAKPKYYIGTGWDPRIAAVLVRNLSINCGFALSLSLTYEARASSTILFALPASSIRENRVLRQSFLFSSRCSNLKKKKKSKMLNSQVPLVIIKISENQQN